MDQSYIDQLFEGMDKVDLKPQSVNAKWIRRPVAHPDFLQHKKDLTYLIKRPKQLPEGDKILFMEYGFSSKLSDVDGPSKVVQDCIADKCGFNDREIELLLIRRKHVKKGEEYIKWKIDSYD